MVSSLKLYNNIFTLPLSFSQVREDTLLDAEVISQLKRPARILMISSGGDTLCKLSTLPNVTKIDAVDANQSQLNLSKLKLTLLKFSAQNRLRILGHDHMEEEIRLQIIKEISRELKFSADTLGPEELLSNEGPDFCGRYEQLFKGIQRELTDRMLHLEELPEKSVLLYEIFQNYFDLDLLVELFGKEATQNPVTSFADHFYEQTSHFLKETQHFKSPFLRQMLSGKFYEEPYEWLQLDALRESEICPVAFHKGFMLDFLAKCKPETYDFIHLSNILDWLQEEQATHILEQTYRVLKKGGVVIIRQLNSSLKIEELCGSIHWNEATSKDFLLRDRSFFYRKIYVGERIV